VLDGSSTDSSASAPDSGDATSLLYASAAVQLLAPRKSIATDVESVSLLSDDLSQRLAVPSRPAYRPLPASAFELADSSFGDSASLWNVAIEDSAEDSTEVLDLAFESL
jgi:hypothetical protein